MIKRFLVISGSANKIKSGEVWGYGPYIHELNIWLKYVDHVTIIAPKDTQPTSPIDVKVEGKSVKFVAVPEVSVKSPFEIFRALVYSPYIIGIILFHSWNASLIHLRAPSNLGLLGSFAQIFYPNKRKIAKYAANFDFSSQQPFFNRLQRAILNNIFLTRNIQMLVYGNWPQATKNCLPFFTASYFEKDKEHTPPRSITENLPIKLLFVGTLRSNKMPLFSIQVCEQLHQEGQPVTLDLYGDGPDRKMLEDYIVENKLTEIVRLHGNQSKETVKRAFQTSHFLIFISKSEGWPKVVAESMFWGCVPITTPVSMVPEMIGNQERGCLIQPNQDEVVTTLKSILNHPTQYQAMANKAMTWSRRFTFDVFETEIKNLLESVSKS